MYKKISINLVIIAYFDDMYSLRGKAQKSFVLCTPNFNSEVQKFTSIFCDWWILLHFVQDQIAVIGIAIDNNLKCNSQMSSELMSAHVME